MELKKFTPLMFLASLGAGGIAVMPFAFMQYSLDHGTGLVKIGDIAHGSIGVLQELYFRFLEAIMITFTSIHILLSLIFFVKLLDWIKTKDYMGFMGDPLRNAAILAPFISIAMTMNVVIGPIRFFIPWFAQNLQLVMAPAVMGWAIIWVLLILTEIRLLKTAFEKSFDVNKISFGWLLHPFALGMLTVVGTGIAAMANNPDIAHTAAFMSLVSGSMGVFLLLVKTVAIFKSHFAQKGLPEREFLPSFLIVVPNITLFAISAFRFGHYLEHMHGFHMGAYFITVITFAFAFEVWYLLFGLSLLSGYFKNHFFNKEYYVSQWGLVCPIVAFGVLGSFVYKVFYPSILLHIAILASMISVIVLFGILLVRHLKCNKILGENKNYSCK